MSTKFDPLAYQAEVDAHAPKSPVLLQCLKAFAVGGLICVIGQGIHDGAVALFALSTEDASTVTAIARQRRSRPGRRAAS